MGSGIAGSGEAFTANLRAAGNAQPGIMLRYTGHRRFARWTACIPSFRSSNLYSVAEIHGAARHVACFPKYGCRSVLRRDRANHAHPRHCSGGTWEEEPRRREAADDSVNPGASVIVVGEVDAGILIVERLPNEVRLLMLCLLPSYQGRGIGCSIVSALQEEAAARRVPLRLDVLKVNPARRFYECLGFDVEDESEYFFHMRYST